MIFSWLKQWKCNIDGHPSATRKEPRQIMCGEPNADAVYCTGCGMHLYTEHTDNSGTGR